MGIKQVVELQSQHHLVQRRYLRDLRGIGEFQVAEAEGRQRAVLVLCVVQVLATHVVRVPGGLKTLVVEMNHTVEDGRG